jgi:hypothetical protein
MPNLSKAIVSLATNVVPGLVVVGLDPVELDLYVEVEKEDYGDEVDYEAYDYENDRY